MLRGLYILPSLFTAGNLALGFVSIIYSVHSDYTPAAWYIIGAMAMDIIDGRVARWTKSTSTFGIEFDSLADLVSFGVAPSLLMYQMALHTMPRIGAAIALFFVVAGAMRLARFNVKACDGESASHFVGLPIPAAAGILASFVLSYELFVVSGQEMTVKTIPLLMKRMPFFFKAIPLLMVVISFLMISSVPYVAIKKFKFNRPKSFQLFTFIVTAIFLVVMYPQNTIFIIFLVYLLSGITEYAWRYFRLRRSLRMSFRPKRNAGEPGPEKKEK
ncbi:MAG: CDP-diacylglycerol--serine O-phosphatidyltransferase [Endomicrobiales bacterium]